MQLRTILQRLVGTNDNVGAGGVGWPIVGARLHAVDAFVGVETI